MSYETITFEVAAAIATITLDRPDNANALNARMAEELFDVSIRCASGRSRSLESTCCYHIEEVLRHE